MATDEGAQRLVPVALALATVSVLMATTLASATADVPGSPSPSSPTVNSEIAVAGSLPDLVPHPSLTPYDEPPTDLLAPLYSRLDELVAGNRDFMAGTFFDKSDGVLVLTATDVARAEVLVQEVLLELTYRAVPPELVEIRKVDRSLDELQDILHGSLQVPLNGVAINDGKIDYISNRVLLGLSAIEDEARAALGRAYGGSVGVYLQERPGAPEDGPERWKDRFPYWGGAGIAPDGSAGDSSNCTTAFAFYRSGSSPKNFQLTAGHCAEPYPTGTDFSSLIGGVTCCAWDNLIGSSAGYTNTYTGQPRDHGDTTVIRTGGGEPVIYNAGARSGTASTVRSVVLGTLAADTPLCVSGSRSGRQCGYLVNGGGYYNFETVRGVTYAVGPLTEIRNNTGVCTTTGDSGAPWYRQVSGGVQGVGVHFGSSPADGDGGICRKRYTNLYYPTVVFGASVLVNP